MNFEFKNVYSSIDNQILLNDVSFSLTNNDFLSVFFENPLSKDSFIKAILGENYLLSGSVYLDGFNITKVPPRDRFCAIVTKEPHLLNNLTIYDNIAYPLRKTKMKEADIEAKVDSIMKELKMDYLGPIMPNDISLYQSLKVSLARAIAFNPKVIILDDPLENTINREEEYISYIKEIYEYLDKPIIIYLNRITPLTKRILTISTTGDILDFSRIELIKDYPVYNKSLDLIGYDRVDKIVNKNYYILDSRIENETLFYSNRSLNLNKIILKSILEPSLVNNIKLNRNYFDYKNSGNDLKFLIKNINTFDSVMEIKTDEFTIYKLSNDKYRIGDYIYYPLSRIEYYSNNFKVSTSINLSNNQINIKVINGIKGLIDVSGKVFNLNKQIPKNLKVIEVDNKVINKLSTNIKDGIIIDRIINIDELKDYYLIETILKGMNKEVVIKVSKDINPLEHNKLSIIFSNSSFKISKYV